MSFKRQGNDGSWLNVLKNRRIAELFAEDVPEGEAHLMKNGRFACMVCYHKPVFDTVVMLAGHRQGKKHLACVQSRAAEEEDLRQLRRKRQHEELQKTGRISQALLDEPTSSGLGITNAVTLLGSAPYNPRVKKARTASDDGNSVHGQMSLDNVPLTTRLSHLPGNNVNELDGRRQTDSATGDKRKQRDPTRRRHNPVNPVTGRKIYSTQNKKRQRNTDEKPSQTIDDYRKVQTALFREEHLLAHVRPYQRKYSSDKSVRTDSPSASNSRSQTQSTCCEAKPVPASETTSSDEKSSLSENLEAPPSAPVPSLRPSSEPVPICGFASGYVKDRFGKWIKDENAEFDSDDESS